VPTVGARLRAVLLAYAAGLALTIIACTGFVFVAVQVGAGPAGAGEKAFARSAAGLSGCALVEGLVLLGVAVAAPRLERRSDAGTASAESVGLGFGRSGASPLAWLAAVVGLQGVTLAAGGVCQLAGAEGVMNTAAGTLRDSRPAVLAIMLVTVGVFPAAGEEALFRGYIQPRLAQVAGRWPAIVATSLAFGLLHGDVAQGASAFGAGLFLGWTADRMGSLRPVIAAHATNNAAFVLSTAAGLTLPPLASISAGVAACAGACALLAKQAPGSEHRHALHE
jgi:membrane protease YdiL (CAAX protease family)